MGYRRARHRPFRWMLVVPWSHWSLLLREEEVEALSPLNKLILRGSSHLLLINHVGVTPVSWTLAQA